MTNMLTKAFNVWREFDNGMLSDPELIQVIQRALYHAWNEGYDDALKIHAPQSEPAVFETYDLAGDEFETLTPTPFTEYDPYQQYTLTEMGEDEKSSFSLPRTGSTVPHPLPNGTIVY